MTNEQEQERRIIICPVCGNDYSDPDEPYACDGCYEYEQATNNEE
jgi:hypothetical protein